MKKNQKFIRSFVLEIAVYSGAVTIYFFLVLHFLGGGLKELFDTNKAGYAFVSLSLIIGQGVFLEILTTKLLSFMRSRTE